MGVGGHSWDKFDWLRREGGETELGKGYGKREQERLGLTFF